jgi:CheY-like chemotaxis protein
LYSILCVDDEPALLDLAKKFLERFYEFKVHTSPSAVENGWVTARDQDPFHIRLPQYPNINGENPDI